MYNNDIIYNIIIKVVKQDYMGNYDNMMEKILKTPTAKDIEPKALQSFLNHYGFKLKRSSGSDFTPVKKPVNTGFFES